MQAEAAWKLIPGKFSDSTPRGSRVRVAILDSGADCKHPGLHQPRRRLTAASTSTCEWNDDNGHGTHVAAIGGAAAERRDLRLIGVVIGVRRVNLGERHVADAHNLFGDQAHVVQLGNPANDTPVPAMQGRPPRISGRREIRLPISVMVARLVQANSGRGDMPGTPAMKLAGPLAARPAGLRFALAL